ncbi:MAG: sulfotransferase [Lachnospiraceae bacterium]|nr:sulfotransferase [Lachnospiraceae bacterium]
MFKKVIALYGVPRSGTSWLGEILNSNPEVIYRYQPLFSYRFKSRLTAESTYDDINVFFRKLYNENNDEFLNQTIQRNKKMYPVFKEKPSNLPVLAYKEVRYLYTIPMLLSRYPDIKIVTISRNPYDVLESWMNAPSEYRQEWNIYEEWRMATKKNEYKPENYYGYYKWKEFIKLISDMKEMYPENFITLRYEDLAEHTFNVIKNLFLFLNIPYTDQTRNFIVASQNNEYDDAYSVYRNKNKKKKQIHIPEEIKSKISQDLKEFKEAKMLGYF